MLAIGAFFHYFTPQTRLFPFVTYPLTRHTVERIVFVLPVIGAALAFGQMGGFVTLALVLLIMLPRAIFFSAHPLDVLFEMLGVVVIGYILVWVIGIQDKERALRQKAVEELRTINSISSTLCQSLDLDSMLDRALGKVLEVVSNLEPRGAVLLLDPVGTTLHLRASRGLEPQLVEHAKSVPLGECLCGITAETGKVMVAKDALNDPRHTRCLLKEPHSHACVPIRSRERLLGVIDLYLSAYYPPDAVDLQLFSAIGSQIGVAVENARLYENLRFYLRQITRVQEDERKRIARDLHDETAQGLVDLSRRLDHLAVSCEPLSESVLVRLEELQQRIDELLQGLRCFIRDLRPSVLDDLGLLPALEGLVDEVVQDGFDAKITISGEPRRLAPEVELELFRIVQEALQNARKHSDANQVVITVEFRTGWIRVTVHDDGQGFDFPGSAGDLVTMGKYGLLGMEERAQVLGGYLNVLTGKTNGTIVTVDVPA